MAKESKTGTCRFCGQSIIVDGGADMTAPQLEEAATMACGCEKALEYREAATRRKNAKERVEELFGENAGDLKQPDAVKQIILDAVDAVCDKRIKQVVVSIRSGLRCRVMQLAKDKIKVTCEMQDSTEFIQ